jgi:hypothetical protein
MDLEIPIAIKFGETHNYILNQLSKLDKRLVEALIKRFNATNDINNLNSLISELEFIVFFKNIGLISEYDKPYKIEKRKLKPDLTVCYFDKIFIAEVYRLGSSLIDDKKLAFITNLILYIEGIESDKILRVEYLRDCFCEEFNFDYIKEKLTTWINSNPIIGEKYQIENYISFEILSTYNGNSTLIAPDPFFLTIKNEKIEQIQDLSDNEITKKIVKYEALIAELNVPYFLLIDVDFISGFSFENFKERFLSKVTEVFRYEEHKEYFQKIGCGSKWSTLGDFYKYQHLSGLIVRFNNQYKILLSPIKKQIINTPEYEKLLKKLKYKICNILD